MTLSSNPCKAAIGEGRIPRAVKLCLHVAAILAAVIDDLKTIHMLLSSLERYGRACINLIEILRLAREERGGHNDGKPLRKG